MQEVPTDLSGSVNSPDEVDEEGVRYRWLSEQEAATLAACGIAIEVVRRHKGNWAILRWRIPIE